MHVEKPLQVGVSEKATNNPPIEILVQSEATLSSLPKTWPVGTVAYTPGRANQWRFTAGGGWEAIGEVDISDLSGVAISSPTDGQVLGYDSTAEAWKNVSLSMLLAEETSGEGADAVTQLDTAWQDIFDAFIAGKAVILYDAEALTAYPVKAVYKSSDSYIVEINSDTYTATAADGNPVKDET